MLQKSSISTLPRRFGRNLTAHALLVAVTVLAAVLVGWPGPVFADDCLRDPFDAADCMRTGGWGVFVANVLIMLSQIPLIGSLVKNASEARRIRREQNPAWPSDLRDTVERIAQATDSVLGRTPEEIAARQRAEHTMYERSVKPGLTLVRAVVAILSGLGAALTLHALQSVVGWIAGVSLPWVIAIGAIVAAAFYLPDAIGFVEEWGTGSSRKTRRRKSKKLSPRAAVAGGAVAGMALMTLATGGLFTVPLLIGAVAGSGAGYAIRALTK